VEAVEDEAGAERATRAAARTGSRALGPT
jgi:hypothetical protein